MAQVTASSSTSVDTAAEVVLGAIGDYTTVRPKILTEHYSNYRVVEGGIGSGTVVGWKLQATKSRSRDCVMAVEQTESEIVERDENSSMITTWRVSPAGSGSEVTLTTSWQGAGGIGGFFEKTFAPLGLKRIQAGMLANLVHELNRH